MIPLTHFFQSETNKNTCCYQSPPNRLNEGLMILIVGLMKKSDYQITIQLKYNFMLNENLNEAKFIMK